MSDPLPSPADSPAPIRILMVDDTPANLLALETILDAPDRQLLQANSGEEALRIVSSVTDIALILMDVQMPGLNGFETVQILKSRRKSRSIPVIFLTAISNDSSFALQGYESGAVDYLFKPINPIFLQAKVGVFLDLYRKNRALAESAGRLEAQVAARTADLSDSMAWLTGIVESSQAPLLGVSRDLRLVTCNHAAREIYQENFQVRLEIGLRLADLPACPGLERAVWESVLAGGHERRACMVRRGGAIRHYDLSFNPARDTAGQVAGGACFWEDLTDRIETERRLRAARDEAEEASRAKSDFLAKMSHELRTPLNAIIGYSEMIVEEASDLEGEESPPPSSLPEIKKITRAGRHLLSLINDVLDLSKIEAGKMELAVHEFSLQPIVSECRDMLTRLAQKKHIALAFPRVENLPSLRQDERKLRQCLINLLGNAVKFTSHGEVRLDIRIESDSENKDWVTFEVGDTGVGMAPEILQNLFTPFVQGDNSTTRQHEGTGLGLVITRHFCHMMGGDIHVTSAPGQGSTFTIRLPRLLE